MWYKLNFSQQKVIVQLVDNPLKRIEIARNLNITSGTLSKPLLNLQELGLIEINNEKKYQIVDSILALWLKNEYGTEGVYLYRAP